MSVLDDLEAAARELVKKHPEASYTALWALLFDKFPNVDDHLIGVALMAATEKKQ